MDSIVYLSFLYNGQYRLFIVLTKWTVSFIYRSYKMDSIVYLLFLQKGQYPVSLSHFLFLFIFMCICPGQLPGMSRTAS